jgi:arginase family enzyme
MIEVSTGQVISFPEMPRLVDVGDLNIYPSDVPRTESAVEEAVRELASSGALLIILGGDEYIALPVARGLARAWAGRATAGPGYVQVSGHLALGDEHPAFGRTWGGATARRILEAGVVEPSRMAWIGAHGRCRGEEWDLVQERDLWIRPLSALRRDGPRATVDAALERAGAGGRPVMLSLDMSVLDGVFGSGTSEPSFDGLTNTELLMLVDALARSPVEAVVLTGVNPRVEPTWTTERLAVVAVLRFLAPRVLLPRESASAEIVAAAEGPS